MEDLKLPNQTTQLLLRLLSTVSLILALTTWLDPLTEANAIILSRPFTLYLIFLCFLALGKFSDLWIFLGSFFMGSYVIGTLFYPHNYLQLWRSFFADSWQLWQRFANQELTQLPPMLVLIFLLFLLVPLVIFFQKYQRFMPLLATGILLMVLLEILNQQDTLKAVINFTIFLFLARFLQQVHGSGLRFWNFFLSIAALSVMFMGAYYLTNTKTQLASSLITHSSVWRTLANDQGFYDFVNEVSRSDLPQEQGFSEDDSALGGPMIDSHETIFQARQDSSHYWKIENKDYYTGRGWENSNHHLEKTIPTNWQLESGFTSLGLAETVRLSFFEKPTYLPIPYGVVNYTPETKLLQGQHLFYAPDHNRLYLKDVSEEDARFTYTYQPAIYTPELLATVTLEQANSSLNNQTGSLTKGAYYSLPESLPPRVASLAKEITAGATSYYQQVKAVEDYLKNSGKFRYSKIDATTLPKDADFVDYFLFTDPVGYCDHFSSSMVVLLRSLGIPARWTKGYSSGTMMGYTPAGQKLFRITSAEAHSWPEVYFAQYGWIPFEPTTSFNSPVEQTPREAANNEETIYSSSSSSTESEKQPQQSTKESSTTVSSTLASTETTASTTADTKNSVKISWWRILLLGLCFLLLGIFAFFHKKIIYQSQLFYLRYLLNDYPQAFRWLLKKANKKIPRLPAMTLREYQQQLAAINEELGQDFKAATAIYERMRYGDQLPQPKDFRRLEKILLALWQIGKKSQ